MKWTWGTVALGVALTQSPSTVGQVVPPAECPGGVVLEPSRAPRVAGGTSCGDGFMIDVMFVYTPWALEGAGDLETLLALIDQDVANCNAAFVNSELPCRVRLVHTAQIEYDETGDDLQLLAGNGDGVMDEVHDWRDAYAADVVALVVESGGCGVAYLFTGDDGSGFQVIDRGCLGGQVLAHELGHNLGSRHYADDPGGFAPYACGHRFTGENGAHATVMAGNRIAHFSNPDVTYDGAPTGLPFGQRGEADNRLTFLQTAPVVASYRCGGDCNDNGLPDDWEVQEGLEPDCDDDLIPDSCEVDLDQDGIPDDCAPPLGTVVVPDDYATIMDAVLAARPGDEIQVRAGTYGRIELFGKALTLRGIDGPAATILDGDGYGPVVLVSHGEGEAQLSGFTIRNGLADRGGAVSVTGMSLRLDDCTLTSNRASTDGGAVLLGHDTALVATKCRFVGNATSGQGGAIKGWAGATLTLEDCEFVGNTAEHGGAMSLWSVVVDATRCRFVENEAQGRGGALIRWGADQRFDDCVFTGNLAGESGAVFVAWNCSEIVFDDCVLAYNGVLGPLGTFPAGRGGVGILGACAGVRVLGGIVHGNLARDGAALAKDESWANHPFEIAETAIRSNFAADGGAAISVVSPVSTPEVRASLFCGNIERDIDGPWVDDGDNTFEAVCDLPDCNENNVPDDLDVRLGRSADVNGNGEPDECECPADLDGDGIVGFADLLAVLAAWGSDGGAEDLDGSGTVDFDDVLIVLGSWGPC